MSYFIRKRKNGWSLLWDWYEEGKRCQKIVPKGEYRKHFFSQGLSYEQAKEQADRINRDLREDQLASRLERMRQATQKRDIKKLKNLPPRLVKQFEEEIENHHDVSRKSTLWRAAKKVIHSLNAPPEDWARQKGAIYNYFQAKKLSAAYAKKVIGVMNQFIELYEVKTSQTISKIPAPTRHAKARIQTQYKKALKAAKASLGLTPQELGYLSRQMEKAHFHWVYLSFWFGLRPDEVDNLSKGEEYAYLERTEKGQQVLKVFQTKLTELEEEARWKEIPILYPEQKEGLKIIEKGLPIKRPLPKTIKSHTKARHHLYAGRKGFPIEMWERGHDFVEVSSWLGHQSMDRTYRDYVSWKRLKLRRRSALKLRKTGT